MNWLAIAIAYVLTGAYYVGRDFSEPGYNQPAYVRERRIIAVVFLVAFWLPWTLNIFSKYLQYNGWKGFRKYFLKEAASLYFTFLCLYIVLWYVLP